jgi:hypothetical protein
MPRGFRFWTSTAWKLLMQVPSQLGRRKTWAQKCLKMKTFSLVMPDKTTLHLLFHDHYFKPLTSNKLAAQLRDQPSKP